MKKLEPWYGSKERQEQVEFDEAELSETRLCRIEDRLSAVVDWIIAREKKRGEPTPSEK